MYYMKEGKVPVSILQNSGYEHVFEFESMDKSVDQIVLS